MKKILIAVVASLFAVMLCSCADGESDPSGTSASQEQSTASVSSVADSNSVEEARTESADDANRPIAREIKLEEELSFSDVAETLRNQSVMPRTDANGMTSNRSFRPQILIGGDDRVRVKETYEYPYSAIAYMRVHARCGCAWSGSGFMVLPDVMLTAAHCLCCTDHRQTADSIELYFGYQENGDYAKKYDGATDYYIGTDFPGGYTSENVEMDYGIVRLNEFVGYDTGFYGMQVKSDGDFDSAKMSVAGYRDGMLKYDTGKTATYSDQVIEVYADAVSGNSGGPIYDGDTTSAIFVADDNMNTNFGRRITEDVFLKVFSVTKSGCTPVPPPDNGVVAVVDTSQLDGDGFVLPESASHLYTREELSGLSDWELAVARNEIPARHGFIFDMPKIKQYFEGKSWYRGVLTREEFQSIVGILNYVEEQNVDTILKLEIEMGSTYVPGGSGGETATDPVQIIEDDYVLPNSTTRRYTREELLGLSDWELAIARNEIPARHGFIFDVPEIKQHFESKSWYRGTLTRDEFRSIVGILNATEEANVDTILGIERERGSKWLPKG